VRHIFRLKRHNVLHIVCFARGKRWKDGKDGKRWPRDGPQPQKKESQFIRISFIIFLFIVPGIKLM